MVVITSVNPCFALQLKRCYKDLLTEGPCQTTCFTSCICVACMFTTAGLELTTLHESKGWQLQTTLVDCLFEHYSTCACK